ncbi:hypothetical protein B0A48_00101 [Cryoendolithus antarcticus]|uniref:Large ribosomal subunit protein mL38 n=1 Tax=Cryoendolithus antarcticus TaxID=1507870 RepID=A0A1V8TTN6_9PEZI|nr:hypothetical protein B0A48_00101 [Cryoendolithus antarcticus]
MKNPEMVSKPNQERRLEKETGQSPITSRRRRALLKQTDGIPFEQMPYQCFQEARKVLQEDRKEKLEAIQQQRERIARLKESRVEPQDEGRKQHRLDSMRQKLERLKILADINDPVVKRRFEDGLGDMNKPIYRHLAHKKWLAYKRPLLMQRITQMNVMPDVLPHVEPSISTELSFAKRRVQHGDIVDSRVSEIAPKMTIQPYDRGERLYTIAVVDPDVPNVEKDGFDYRCHFLAANIAVSPTSTNVRFSTLDAESQTIIPWLPPYSQKGLKYSRLAIFILEQPLLDPLAPATSAQRSQSIDVAAIKAADRYTQRDGFILRSLVNSQNLKPAGVDLFRTQYDEGTAGVMQRAGIEGWDVEFKRKRIEPLPYKRLKGESTHPSLLAAPRPTPTAKRTQKHDSEITARYIQLVDPSTNRLYEDHATQQPLPPRTLRGVLATLDFKTHRLIQVSPDEPRNRDFIPVCKIVEKKDEYRREKLRKEAQKESKALQAKTNSVKTLELNWAIDGNDLSHRLDRVKVFLEEGRKVEIVVASKKKGRKATAAECEGLLGRVREVVDGVKGAREVKGFDGKMGGFGVMVLQGKGTLGGKEEGVSKQAGEGAVLVAKS